MSQGNFNFHIRPSASSQQGPALAAAQGHVGVYNAGATTAQEDAAEEEWSRRRRGLRPRGYCRRCDCSLLDPACVWHKWWNLLGGALQSVQIQHPKLKPRCLKWWKPRRNTTLRIEAYGGSEDPERDEYD